MRVLNRRVKAPEALKEHQDMLYDYVLTFQEQNGKINYAAMANDLRSYNYDRETNEGILPKSRASITSGAYSVPGNRSPKNVFTDGYTILDGQKVPQNVIENVEKRLVKMNRTLKGKYPNQAAFEKAVAEKAGADKNGNLNVDDFKAFLVEQCRDELIARKVTKQDIEGFMSAFVFNQHGGTDVKAVAPLVYEQDPNKLSTIINTRVRANPPPEVLNAELANRETTLPMDNSQAKRMREIMSNLEDTTFDSKPRLYKSFTAIDQDGDGFISYKDFEQHLSKNKIHASQDEILCLMHNVLDPERKGYIDFAHF